MLPIKTCLNASKDVGMNYQTTAHDPTGLFVKAYGGENLMPTTTIITLRHIMQNYIIGAS